MEDGKGWTLRKESERKGGGWNGPWALLIAIEAAVITDQ